MLTIIFRTVLIYVILIVTLRLMGKREIGELEVTDLVSTLLLSEIASLPITESDIPLTHAVIPMLTLLFLEVASSFLLIRVPRLRGILAAKPTVLILNGKLDQKALGKQRISMDELMSEIRGQGMTDLGQVDCAILEKNGKLTILPKAEYAAPTVKDLGITAAGGGLMHIVYNNGKYSKEGLRLIGKDEEWVKKQLLRRGLDLDTLFCVTANAKGDLYWIKKD